MKKIFTICLILSLIFTANFIFGITASAVEPDVETVENENASSEEAASIEDYTIINGISDDSTVTEKDDVGEEVDSITTLESRLATISGTLLWEDDLGVRYPLRFTKVEVFRTDLIIFDKRSLDTTVTDNDGEFTLSFETGWIDGEYDISIYVYAQGTDISVCDADGDVYFSIINGENDSNLNDLPAISYNIGKCVFAFNSNGATDENIRVTDTRFWEATQISQSAIAASKYYEDMKGEDVEDVEIVYPHNIEGKGCFYNSGGKRIYIVEESSSHTGPIKPYASCDVITHEYGHHVAHCEGINNSPGNWHYDTDMADHYQDHFSGIASGCNNRCALKINNQTGFNFTEAECKLKGCQIAWSEGFATFFGELAQQYFYNTYISVSSYNLKPQTFSDETYTSYNSSIHKDIELGKVLSESCEASIYAVLYDMYDIYDATEAFDNIYLTHQQIWNLIIDSQAKTFYDFIVYLQGSPIVSVDMKKLGDIIFEYIIPLEITEADINADATEFTIEYKEESSKNAKKYRINFYDSYYNLIGSTDFKQLNAAFGMSIETDIISDELLDLIIDSGIIFYTTLEIQEGDGGVEHFGNSAYYITQYESNYTLCSINDIYDCLNNVTNLYAYSNQKHNWYMFTAPSNDTFVFEVTSGYNFSLELFSKVVAGDSVENRISINYSDENTGTCTLVYDLVKYQTVYIRITNLSLNEGTCVGYMDYDLDISYINHTHTYNYSYITFSSSSHKAFCICGDYITESHKFSSSGLGYRCDYCNYFTKFIMVPITDTKPNVDICDVNLYNKDEDE